MIGTVGVLVSGHDGSLGTASPAPPRMVAVRRHGPTLMNLEMV